MYQCQPHHRSIAVCLHTFGSAFSKKWYHHRSLRNPSNISCLHYLWFEIRLQQFRQNTYKWREDTDHVFLFVDPELIPTFSYRNDEILIHITKLEDVSKLHFCSANTYLDAVVFSSPAPTIEEALDLSLNHILNNACSLLSCTDGFIRISDLRYTIHTSYRRYSNEHTIYKN